MARSTRPSGVDARTFRLTLKEKTGIVLEALSKPSSPGFIMPKRVAETDPYKQIDDYTGSGPFMLKRDETKPGEKTVYVKNRTTSRATSRPRGWPAARSQGRSRRMGGDARQQTAVNALIAGEIDVIEQPQHDLFPLMKADKNVRLLRLNTWGSSTFPLQTSSSSRSNNAKVRQALLYAFRQKDFLDAVIGDPEYYQECKAMFICGGPYGLTTGWDDKYTGDIEKAKQLPEGGRL